MSYINLIFKPNYSIIQLKRGRANPINQEMVDELSKTINLLEDDDSVKGIIITGQPDFFFSRFRYYRAF
jgi:enoyl-CoA hydratase/carnithine racemase